MQEKYFKTFHRWRLQSSNYLTRQYGINLNKVQICESLQAQAQLQQQCNTQFLGFQMWADFTTLKNSAHTRSTMWWGPRHGFQRRTKLRTRAENYQHIFSSRHYCLERNSDCSNFWQTTKHVEAEKWSSSGKIQPQIFCKQWPAKFSI